MGLFKDDPPPPPDMSGVANASKEAAQLSYKLGQEQMAWARETYASDKQVTDRVVESFLETEDANQAAAVKDRARYEAQFQPLEDKLAQDALDYSSPERKDLEMGRAQATVAQQFEANRANTMRELESYGVNPGATRFAALDVGLRAQEGATKAAAGNQAAQMVDATGRALRSEAINVGRGYPGQIAGTYNTALQSGTGAVNSTLAQTGSGASTMGTNAQYMGLGNQAVGTWGNTLNMGYQNELGAYKAQQSASSGLGSLAGLAGGMLLGPVKPWAFAADGGKMEAGGPGGAVPMQASLSSGRNTDDVSAQLTAGEFVVPKGAVEWFGEKHFYGLIEKADKERVEKKQSTGAVPEMGMAPARAPTFTSRPGAAPGTRSAIPSR